MKKQIEFIITLLLIFILITAGIINIKNPKNERSTGKIQIVTTLFPQYDFVKQIGGDKVDVVLLLPPGSESHTYEPTPQDMQQINNSDLFVFTGEEMEPWADNLISGLKNDIRVLDLSKTVDLINSEEFEEEHEGEGHEHDEGLEHEHNHDEDLDDEHDHEHEKEQEHQDEDDSNDDHKNETEDEHHHEHDEHHHTYDPHIWLNPQYAIQMVKSIESELIAIDPENSEYYKKNAEQYIAEIQQLDSEFEDTVKNSSNPKIAFGGAFAYAYFVERYNLDFISAYETCGESAEPSTTKMKEVIEYIRKNKIPVVFYKEYTSGTIAKTLSEATGAKMLVFNTVHNVSKNELQNGATYVSIMRENLENLKQALK